MQRLRGRKTISRNISKLCYFPTQTQETSYVVLDCDFEQVMLPNLNLHVLVQYFINRYIFSLFNQRNKLVNK